MEKMQKPEKLVFQAFSYLPKFISSIIHHPSVDA
jgi:hypothetical protein